MTTKPNSQLTLLHAVCVALILLCFAVGEMFFGDVPHVRELLFGAATWLWGKLAFTPSRALIERIVQTLDPQEVVRIQSIAPTAKPPEPPRAAIE